MLKKHNKIFVFVGNYYLIGDIFIVELVYASIFYKIIVINNP